MGLNEIKWVGTRTDGSLAMCGKKSGVVNHVLQISPNSSWIHSNIQRDALVSKSISDDSKNFEHWNSEIKIKAVTIKLIWKALRRDLEQPQITFSV